MFSSVDRRRILGAGLSLAGAATIAGTLVLTGPATAVVNAASTGTVFLVISITDSAAGQPAAGGTVTVTALVSNSSASGVGDATPTVSVSFSTSALSFVSNGAGWTCTPSAGTVVCTDGTITAGGGASVPLAFAVVGNPGNPASVTGTVSDPTADVNVGSFTGGNTVTHSASVGNAGSYTKDVPAGAYPAKVGPDQIVTSTTTAGAYTFVDGSNTIIVRIPASAVPQGSHLSIYRADSSFWSSSFSSSSRGFVNGYAVQWIPSGSSTGANAGSPVTIDVDNTVVVSTDSLFRATTSGIGTQTGTVNAGGWTVSFTEDPGFVLAQAAAAPAPSSSSSSSNPPPANSSTSAAPAATISAPPSGGGGTRGGTTTLPLGIGVLLFIGGAVVLGTNRRRQNG